MGFFDRLGNVARGALHVESRAWAEGGGLEGRLERLGEGLRGVVQGEAPAAPPDDVPVPPGPDMSRPGTPQVPAGAPPDPESLELAALDADLAAGRITRGEWSRRRAELRRARHGRRL
jgi:hypothetical protein